MSDPIEKRFFKALQSGDKNRINSAFEEVYRAYSKLVAFVVGEYISDRETIKEVVNDVFVSFFNHADGIYGSIKYFLTVSAKNSAINRAKKDNKRCGDLPLEYADVASEFEPRSEILAELKKRLGDEEIKIIVMHAVEGYSFREIAKTLDKNPNTVLTIYSRALKKFRKEARNDE